MNPSKKLLLFYAKVIKFVLSIAVRESYGVLVKSICVQYMVHEYNNR